MEVNNQLSTTIAKSRILTNRLPKSETFALNTPPSATCYVPDLNFRPYVGQIEFSVTNHGRYITIHVIRAQDLNPLTTKMCNSYVTVQLIQRLDPIKNNRVHPLSRKRAHTPQSIQVSRTETVHNTFDPLYNQRTSLKLHPEATKKTLIISVCSFAYITCPDEHLGTTIISSLPSSHVYEHYRVYLQRFPNAPNKLPSTPQQSAQNQRPTHDLHHHQRHHQKKSKPSAQQNLGMALGFSNDMKTSYSRAQGKVLGRRREKMMIEGQSITLKTK